jgi:hypothetical protein
MAVAQMDMQARRAQKYRFDELCTTPLDPTDSIDVPVSTESDDARIPVIPNENSCIARKG